MISPTDIDVILLDMGGVLVEFKGIPRLLDLLGGRIDEAALWKHWLTSEAVRAFERGGSTPETFALGIIEELGLPISPATFLTEFESWLTRKYPGADELLTDLAPHYTLACFSNTNALHWPVMRDTFGLGRFFDRCFASHEIGRLKPDAEAFLHVADALASPPDRILFLDDNIINVEGAVAVGMQGVRVEGVEGVRKLMMELEMKEGREKGMSRPGLG